MSNGPQGYAPGVSESKFGIAKALHEYQEKKRLEKNKIVQMMTNNFIKTLYQGLQAHDTRIRGDIKELGIYDRKYGDINIFESAAKGGIWGGVGSRMKPLHKRVQYTDEFKALMEDPNERMKFLESTGEGGINEQWFNQYFKRGVIKSKEVPYTTTEEEETAMAEGVEPQKVEEIEGEVPPTQDYTEPIKQPPSQEVLTDMPADITGDEIEGFDYDMESLEEIASTSDLYGLDNLTSNTAIGDPLLVEVDNLVESVKTEEPTKFAGMEYEGNPLQGYGFKEQVQGASLPETGEALTIPEGTFGLDKSGDGSSPFELPKPWYVTPPQELFTNQTQVSPGAENKVGGITPATLAATDTGVSGLYQGMVDDQGYSIDPTMGGTDKAALEEFYQEPAFTIPEDTFGLGGEGPADAFTIPEGTFGMGGQETASSQINPFEIPGDTFGLDSTADQTAFAIPENTFGLDEVSGAMDQAFGGGNLWTSLFSNIFR